MMIESEPMFRKTLYGKLCPGTNLDIDSVANTGVYLLRNTDIGRGIMSEWMKGVAKYPDLRSEWPGDQGIFNCELTTHGVYRNHIKISQCGSFSNLCGYRGGGRVDGWTQHYMSGGCHREKAIPKHILEKTREAEGKILDKQRPCIDRAKCSIPGYSYCSPGSDFKIKTE